MRVFALFLVTACSARPTPATKPLASSTATDPAAAAIACPLPTSPDVQARFAVGVVPDHRVEALVGEAAHCHDEFVANDVVKLDGGRPRLVAAGTFQGHCPHEDTMRTFEAVAPGKVVVAVDAALHEGELGLGKPVALELARPDKLVSVRAGLADRCGTPLDSGESRNLAKWTLGSGCEQVVKLAPWDASIHPTTESMRFAAVGAGSCTVHVEMLGVSGDVAVTVK